MAFFRAKAGQKAGFRVMLKYFEINKGFSLLYKTNRFHVAVRLITGHRRRQNVARTSVTHSTRPCVPLFCCYHILTSSVIYY